MFRYYFMINYILLIVEFIKGFLRDFKQLSIYIYEARFVKEFIRCAIGRLIETNPQRLSDIVGYARKSYLGLFVIFCIGDYLYSLIMSGRYKKK